MSNTSNSSPATPTPAAAGGPVVQPENAAAETTPAGVDPAEAASYLAAITHNYSQYRAAATIPWGNAIAFNIGDPVPADYPTLEQLKSDGLVEAVAQPAKSKRG
jgi:hypothetical protein